MFFQSNNVRSTMEKRTTRGEITGLFIIVFASVFIVSCGNKDNNGNKVVGNSKKDSVTSMDVVYRGMETVKSGKEMVDKGEIAKDKAMTDKGIAMMDEGIGMIKSGQVAMNNGQQEEHGSMGHDMGNVNKGETTNKDMDDKGMEMIHQGLYMTQSGKDMMKRSKQHGQSLVRPRINDNGQRHGYDEYV